MRIGYLWKANVKGEWMGLWCLCLSIEHLCFNFSSVVFRRSYGKKMKDHELWWKRKGGIGNRRGMKNKEGEYSQRVWLSETAIAIAEGWEELVFHICDCRN